MQLRIEDCRKRFEDTDGNASLDFLIGKINKIVPMEKLKEQDEEEKLSFLRDLYRHLLGLTGGSESPGPY